MCESKKDPTVVQILPPLPPLFSVDTRSLAGLQCLSSLQVKEPEREGIQVAFSEMVGSASTPVCMHELCLSCSSAVLCCNDQREEETTRERGGRKKKARISFLNYLSCSFLLSLSFSRSVKTCYRPSLEEITDL